MRRGIGFGAALFSSIALISCNRTPDPLPALPRIVLWAWERPENLEFIDTGTVGVAFLARTITLRDGHMTSQGRRQPLRVPPDTALVGVVRVESDGSALPAPRGVAGEIVSAAQSGSIRAMQIDFDARQSERSWYRALVNEVRRLLPPGLPLTITALASWCEADGWIQDLPVADAVPMLFRMGAGERWQGGEFRVKLCRSAIGVSTDELPARIPRERRLFFFHPRPWTREAYLGVLEELKRWR